jgi:hypothetical protein
MFTLLSVALAIAAQSAPEARGPLLPPHFEELLEMRLDTPISTYMPVSFTPGQLGAGERATLYLNRFGDAYSCGEDDAARNVSSIACSAEGSVAIIDAFSLGDAAWTEVLGCVTELFSPFSITVTDQEPLEGSYIEASVGGTPDQAGMSNGVGGVAPFACELIPRAVVYVFSGVYGDDTRSICETAAQELAHAFGLDHELLCEDPMTYLAGCGEKAFVDEWAPCGEYEPRACTCGGETQNSVQWMRDMFGNADGTQVAPVVDSEPPLVQFLTPTSDGIVPANSELQVSVEASDDVGLTVVELEWDFSGERMFCPSDGAAYSCTREGTAYTWRISVGMGLRDFRVRVRDVVGNEAYTEDRSMWFSPDGNGPPDDAAPPSVIVGVPLQDTFVTDAEPLRVVATMFDDTGLARAEIDWQGRFGIRTIGCPFESDRFSCAVEGSTYTWTFSPREGQRSYRLRAVDLVGNMTESELITFTVDPSSPPGVNDGNDSIDTAVRIGCGDSVSRDGNDSDWFRLVADEGTTVHVLSNDPKVGLLVTDGARRLGMGDAALEVVAGDVPLFIAATPSSSVDGDFSLSVACEAPAPVETNEPKPDPKGCASAGAPASLALLAVSLRRRRRR